MIDIFADEKTLDVSNGTISVGHFYKNRLGNALWCRATWCKFLLNTAQLIILVISGFGQKSGQQLDLRIPTWFYEADIHEDIILSYE